MDENSGDIENSLDQQDHLLDKHFEYGAQIASNHHKPATCKFCFHGLSGKKERLLNHIKNCSKNSSEDRKRAIEIMTVRASCPRRLAKMNIHQKTLDKLDKLWTKALVIHSIPFSFTDSPEIKEIFSTLGHNYTTPSRATLASTIIPKEVALPLRCRDELVRSAVDRSLMLQVDSWTDPTGRTIYAFLINFTNPIRTKFLHSLSDQTGLSHRSEDIGQLILNVIEDIGEEKINGLVTDGASNMNNARTIVSSKHKEIKQFRCYAHFINLLSYDISKFPPFKKTLEQSIELAGFINRRSRLTKSLQDKGGKVKLWIRTRWYSMVTMLKSIRDDSSNISNLVSELSSEFPQNIKSTISDGAYWNTLNSILTVCNPLVKIISLVESDSCSLADFFICLLVMGFLYIRLKIQR